MEWLYVGTPHKSCGLTSRQTKRRRDQETAQLKTGLQLDGGHYPCKASTKGLTGIGLTRIGLWWRALQG